MVKYLLLVFPLLFTQKCDQVKTENIQKELQLEVDKIIAESDIPGVSLGVVLPDDQVLKVRFPVLTKYFFLHNTIVGFSI